MRWPFPVKFELITYTRAYIYCIESIYNIIYRYVQYCIYTYNGNMNEIKNYNRYNLKSHTR